MMRPSQHRGNGVTIFHLLRHGEHAVQGRICAGRMPGVSLSERGRGEVERSAERLAGAGIAAIYASPMERARRKPPASSAAASTCRSPSTTS